MLTYQIVVEADNTARYVIQHDDLLGKTMAGPNVCVLSQTYLDAYMTQFSLANVSAALTNMGIVNALTPDQLNGLT